MGPFVLPGRAAVSSTDPTPVITQRRTRQPHAIGYDQEGFTRAPHRALLRATGQIRDKDDFDKPFIAVCNSYTDIVPGHVHVPALAQAVKAAIREAGAVPFEFNTIGVDDGIVMGHEGMHFSLPSRELIADCVETMARAHCFDGMICIPNCDKIVPGMLMGAARANLPAVFVSGGAMRAGRDSKGQKVDLISVFEGVGAHAAGAIDDASLEELEVNGCPTCGSCSGMFTANSINCLCEALGIALPGNGTILAVAPERRELVERAARVVVQLVHDGVTFRDIVTPHAIDNAVALDVARGIDQHGAARPRPRPRGGDRLPAGAPQRHHRTGSTSRQGQPGLGRRATVARGRRA